MSLRVKYMPGATVVVLSMVSNYQIANIANEAFFFYYRVHGTSEWTEIDMTKAANDTMFYANSWKSVVKNLTPETTYDAYCRTKDRLLGEFIDTSPTVQFTTCPIGKFDYEVLDSDYTSGEDYKQELIDRVVLPAAEYMKSVGYQCGNLVTEFRYKQNATTAETGPRGIMDFSANPYDNHGNPLFSYMCIPTFCHESRHWHGVINGFRVPDEAEKVYKFECNNNDATVAILNNHSTFLEVDLKPYHIGCFVLKGLRGNDDGVIDDLNNITIIDDADFI